MEEALHALLLEADAVTALAGDRIAWSLLPRGSALPSVALHGIDDVPDYTMGGPSGLCESRVQIDCWAGTYGQALALSRAVVGALSGAQVVVDGVLIQGAFLLSKRDMTEDGTPPAEVLFRISLDFQIWHGGTAAADYGLGAGAGNVIGTGT
jgi:hypothetical protein